MYAIVDIETTGGFASGSGITEISIRIHDGTRVTDRFDSLVNPGEPIPHYIQALTGITDAMVEGAPSFESIASRVHSLLEGKIFVAHNVNFDFSFIKHHLGLSGIEFRAPKLCTVRLSRKIFPGLPSYSLGRLCRHLEIPISQRHRSGGDTEATVRLFEILLSQDQGRHIDSMLGRIQGEQSLPMHLPAEQVAALPMRPGVYYFHDHKDKIIYVGKAVNIRKRVLRHFTNNHPGRRKQEFLRMIHRVTCRECPTELMSLILESAEIHRLWPAFNRAQKSPEPSFGLFSYPDQNGYLRLCVEKRRKFHHPHYTFHQIQEGTLLLKSLAREFQLCPTLCFLEFREGPCTARETGSCTGACEKLEPPSMYNPRVEAALESIREDLPSFLITDSGLHPSEKSCLLVEQGIFYGMGLIPEDLDPSDISTIRALLIPYPENSFIRNLLFHFAEQHPEKVTGLDSLVG